MLVLLSLERTPSHATITGTRRTWVHDLMHERTWNRERDVPLIRAAFARIRTTCNAWPSTAKFLEVLSAITPLPTFQRLPPPKHSDAEFVAKMRAGIAETLGLLDGPKDDPCNR